MLSAVQLMDNNYFGGILEGLMRCLSLTAPLGEEQARSTQEGVERWIAVALKKCTPLASPCENYLPRGLHLGYEQDFLKRGTEPAIPALSSTALPDLLQAMDHLQLEIPPVPAILRGLLKEESLFDTVGAKEEVPDGSQIPFLSRLFSQFDEPSPTKPKEAKVPPPTLLEGDQTPEKSRKVRGLKSYLSLPSPASKEGGFKVPSGKAGQSGKGSITPSGRGFLPSVNLGKDSVAQKDSPSVCKENTEAKGFIDQKRKITDLQEAVSKKMKQSPGIAQGLTITHELDSSITAAFSVNGNQNSLGSTQPLSDGEPDPEVPEHKVKKVAFSSDEKFSPKAKNKPAA